MVPLSADGSDIDYKRLFFFRSGYPVALDRSDNELLARAVAVKFILDSRQELSRVAVI